MQCFLSEKCKADWDILNVSWCVVLECSRYKNLGIPSVVFTADDCVEIRNLFYKSLEAPVWDGDQKDVPRANI